MVLCSTFIVSIIFNYPDPPKERSINAHNSEKLWFLYSPTHFSGYLVCWTIDPTVLLFHVGFINTVIPHDVIATTTCNKELNNICCVCGMYLYFTALKDKEIESNHYNKNVDISFIVRFWKNFHEILS